jgi:hypothetical protein
MNPITSQTVLGFEDWVRVRGVLRPLFILEKERRRFALGDHLTLLFENLQTVWYQIEEMLRVERIVEADAVQHEIDTYNGLLPTAGELSATLMIEYADARERDAALLRLVGIERHLWLRVGDRRIAAEFEAAQIGENQVSAVQFVRFAVGGRAAERLVELAGKGALALELDHPAMTVSARVPVALAQALADDLRASVAIGTT